MPVATEKWDVWSRIEGYEDGKELKSTIKHDQSTPHPISHDSGLGNDGYSDDYLDEVEKDYDPEDRLPKQDRLKARDIVRHPFASKYVEKEFDSLYHRGITGQQR